MTERIKTTQKQSEPKARASQNSPSHTTLSRHKTHLVNINFERSELCQPSFKNIENVLTVRTPSSPLDEKRRSSYLTRAPTNNLQTNSSVCCVAPHPRAMPSRLSHMLDCDPPILHLSNCFTKIRVGSRVPVYPQTSFRTPRSSTSLLTHLVSHCLGVSRLEHEPHTPRFKI